MKKKLTVLSFVLALFTMGLAFAVPRFATADPEHPTDIVGVWEVDAAAPYRPHLFSFHADGTMTTTNPTNVQENPAAPHGGTNDSLGLGIMKQFTIATFQGLGTAVSALFRGDTAKASEQVAGPVGIVVVLKDGSLMGYEFVLLIIGVISLSLAIMNVLPIPALDGGRFYVMLLSRLFGKRLSKGMEERIVGSSFVFLLLLIVLITIVDVKRFF